MGILIFVDDYLNIMTLSTCMRKLTDRQKVPRETLSYIIDSTGAPVCALLPFSTWAVFFAGLFYAEAGIPELGYGSAINTFCAVIPFIFYAIAAVALVPLFSLGLVPKLGRMKKAYRRVEETGKVYSPESAELNLEDEDDSPAITGCLWDFVLPIGTLIALTIVGGELFLALVAAIAVCFLLYIPRKKLSLTRFCDLAMHGFCNMIPTVAIIFFAFVMQEGMTEIGIAPFVINAVKPILSPAVFPAIAFLVVAALNFTTGSVWGITAVTVPDPAAPGLLHRGQPPAGDGRHRLRRHPGQPRLLLLRRHGAHLQLLQDGEYGPRPVPTALFPVCGRAFGGGLSGVRPPDVV